MKRHHQDSSVGSEARPTPYLLPLTNDTLTLPNELVPNPLPLLNQTDHLNKNRDRVRPECQNLQRQTTTRPTRSSLPEQELPSAPPSTLFHLQRAHRECQVLHRQRTTKGLDHPIIPFITPALHDQHPMLQAFYSSPPKCYSTIGNNITTSSQRGLFIPAGTIIPPHTPLLPYIARFYTDDAAPPRTAYTMEVTGGYLDPVDVLYDTARLYYNPLLQGSPRNLAPDANTSYNSHDINCRFESFEFQHYPLVFLCSTQALGHSHFPTEVIADYGNGEITPQAPPSYDW